MNDHEESERESGFVNAPVDPVALPDFRRVPLNPIAPAYLTVSLIGRGAFWLVVLLAAVIGPRLPWADFPPAWWQWAAVLVLAGLSGIYTVVDARRRGWALRDHDLIYRYGVIWHKTVIVPFARIQHVEAVSGPIERHFKLMRLKCFTAGGGASDLTVEGLNQADARRVRQYLLEQIREDGDSEDSTPESPPES